MKTAVNVHCQLALRPIINRTNLTGGLIELCHSYSSVIEHEVI